MGRPLRWGLLGAGRIAATVAADIAASPGSVLAAVAARDGERARSFAARHGVARAYGSYAELVADSDVDIVYIATTHAQHHENALLALDAGKPVLVEKAFTLNAAQAREVVAAARARELFCMEAMWMRFDPLVRQAVDLIRSGELGEVVSVRAGLSQRFDYSPSHRLFDLAAGGGALLDLGVYPITFAWLVLGCPDTVTAAGARAPTGSDATAAVQWSYRDGRVAQLHTSAWTDSPDGALVCGTQGWLRLTAPVYRPAGATVVSPAGTRTSAAPPQVGNGYRRQIAEVQRCLASGLLESPVVPLDDTVAILETIDEARRQLGVRYPCDDRKD